MNNVEPRADEGGSQDPAPIMAPETIRSNADSVAVPGGILNELVVAVGQEVRATMREYFTAKGASEQQSLQLEDRIHRRGIVMFGIAVGGLLVLCLIAMLLREAELVRWILGSGLGVAAGAGLKGLLRGVPPK